MTIDLFVGVSSPRMAEIRKCAGIILTRRASAVRWMGCEPMQGDGVMPIQRRGRDKWVDG